MIEQGLFKVSRNFVETLKKARAENQYMKQLLSTAPYPHVDHLSPFQAPASIMVTTKVRAIEHGLEPNRMKYWEKSVFSLPRTFPAGEVLNHPKAQFECVADTDFDAGSVYNDIGAAGEDSIGALPEHSHQAGEVFDVIAVASSMNSKDDA